MWRLWSCETSLTHVFSNTLELLEANAPFSFSTRINAAISSSVFPSELFCLGFGFGAFFFFVLITRTTALDYDSKFIPNSSSDSIWSSRRGRRSGVHVGAEMGGVKPTVRFCQTNLPCVSSKSTSLFLFRESPLSLYLSLSHVSCWYGI